MDETRTLGEEMLKKMAEEVRDKLGEQLRGCSNALDEVQEKLDELGLKKAVEELATLSATNKIDIGQILLRQTEMGMVVETTRTALAGLVQALLVKGAVSEEELDQGLAKVFEKFTANDRGPTEDALEDRKPQERSDTSE